MLSNFVCALNNAAPSFWLKWNDLTLLVSYKIDESISIHLYYLCYLYPVNKAVYSPTTLKAIVVPGHVSRCKGQRGGPRGALAAAVVPSIEDTPTPVINSTVPAAGR